jgi:hypothetical protein
MNTKPSFSRALPIKPSKPWHRRILVGTLLLFLISTLLLIRYSDNGSKGASEPLEITRSISVEGTDTPRKDDLNPERRSTSLSSLDSSEEHPESIDGGVQEASRLPKTSLTGEAPPAVPARVLKVGPSESRPQEETIEWVLVRRGRFTAEVGGFPTSGFADVTLAMITTLAKRRSRYVSFDL